MRSYLHRIFKLLNLGGRGWVVFLLALLLSFSTWIIHKLSLDYNVYLKAEVIAASNIEGRSNFSASATEVMAKCRTTGWHILYSHMSGDDAVYVNLPASSLQHEEDERYYVTSEKLHEYADQIFGSGVSVEYFVTDRVYFKFPQENHKRVPVKPVSSLSFEDQFIALSPIEIVPDSVTVYGDQMHLDALEYVATDNINHSSINEDFSGMISLVPISGMRFSVDEVHYKMDVSRYIEITRKQVPVTIEGAPAGKEFIADPPAVDVTLKVQFPLKADPNKDISVFAEYDDLKSSISGQIAVQLSSLPLGVIRYDISPVSVSIKERQK